ncbi:MDR family MFS transporter [Ktedonospora formicarum]|uniref:EmrB/QacA family drug resistance transporter n=1 Tax=Ktedonospora formicarum TaxID=2778364 RepID=A0A8J3HYC9_9CHLR|nr:MDR family MFS transporter [Ktedonospora formicarum]GHO46004.1 EmrB/QacA family drug resistance transporter [Ktedonospora formicarum]
MLSLSRFQGRLAYKWWVMLTVALGMLMSMMDSTIVNIAIPQMQRAFAASLHDVQWITTIYMITQAIVIPLAPYLTTLLGAKRAYLWSLSSFLVGSVLCGCAWNLSSLIVFRCLQGIGGGVLLPMVMILQMQAFPYEERGKAGSVMGLALMVAPTLGPFLGGYLVGSFGWQWAFFINIPLGIIAVILAQQVLKPVEGQAGTRFDSGGFLASACGTALLLYAAPDMITNGPTIWNTLLLVGSFISLALFVALERRLIHQGRMPLLDLRRFHDRAFTFSVLTQILIFFVWFGVLFLLPIYLQALHQETPLQAGIIQGAISLATLIVLPIGGWIADRIGPRAAVIPGLLLLAGALAALVMLALDTPIWILVCLFLFLGAANAMTNQVGVSALSQIKKEEGQAIANASTLLSVLRATAAPLGVAIIASFVQIRSQHFQQTFVEQGLSKVTLLRQSELLALHDSFLLAAFLILIAFGTMCCVPRLRGRWIPASTRNPSSTVD